LKAIKHVEFFKNIDVENRSKLRKNSVKNGIKYAKKRIKNG